MTAKRYCDCCEIEVDGRGEKYIDETFYQKEFCRSCAIEIDDLILEYIKKKKQA